MEHKHFVLKIYFKAILFIFPYLSFGQNEAIIVGKVINPQGRSITLRHRNNPLFYDENILYSNLDTDNNFFVRIKTKTSQTIYMDYQDEKFKFFLSPGDTLKINFDNKLTADKATLEGSAAANNIYLLKTNAAFADWLDESLMANQIVKLSPVEYQMYVDSIYKVKRRFFDNYPITEINNLSSEFLDFTSQDIQYWRAYMLMKYYDDYHTNGDASKSIDDNYFNFLAEIPTSSVNALNNDYCLKYLSLYLNFIKDKYLAAYKVPSVVQERRVVTQTVRPIMGNVRVLLDPFTSKEIIGWISPLDRAEFLNLKTDDKFRYIGTDTTFEDTFLKIKTEDGKIGWVPASSVILIDNVTVEKKIFERHCFDVSSPLCGLEKYSLSGRVLYLVAAKEILLDFLNDEESESEKRVKAFSNANTQFQDYNDFLYTALIQTYAKKKSGLNALGFIPICVLSDIVNEKITPLVVENKDEVKPKAALTLTYIVPAPSSNKVRAFFNDNSNPANEIKPKKNEIFIANPVVWSNIKTETSPPSISVSPVSVINNDIDKSEKKDLENKNLVDYNGKPKISQKPAIKDNNTISTTPPMSETNATKTAISVKANSNTENKPLLKVDQPHVVTDNKIKIIAPAIDYTVENKKLFQSDAIIDEAGLNLQQELVRANPNDNEPIKRFDGLVLGEESPKYKFTDVNGREVASEDLLGKIVFIEFWATWCGPCQAQMSHAQELAKRYKDKDDVVFVFISQDQDASAWKESLLANKWNEGMHGNDGVILPLNFGVQVLPNTFIIDKKGKVSFNSLISKRSSVTDEKTIDTLARSQK